MAKKLSHCSTGFARESFFSDQDRRRQFAAREHQPVLDTLIHGSIFWKYWCLGVFSLRSQLMPCVLIWSYCGTPNPKMTFSLRLVHPTFMPVPKRAGTRCVYTVYMHVVPLVLKCTQILGRCFHYKRTLLFVSFPAERFCS
jgi:hypothetical protein